MQRQGVKHPLPGGGGTLEYRSVWKPLGQEMGFLDCPGQAGRLKRI